MNDAKRLRRPTAGGYVRGDETRLRIIEAAIELFGEHGFDGASTRDIAARAGVNAPALQYYFENKEGVFRACAEHIADETWRNFEPVVAHATEVLRRKSGSGAASKAASQADAEPPAGADTDTDTEAEADTEADTEADIEALIDAFIRIQEVIADRMFLKVKACSGSNPRLFFAREQAGHGPSIASEILTRRLRKPLNDVGAQLIARITGMAVDDPLTLIRMLSLHGQLMMFYIAPRSTLGLLGWTEIDEEKGERLKDIIREQTRTLLHQWSEARLGRRRASGKKPA
jgi:TetR/AcrR family transcriptional regulator, regulator of cefoperazone and chloramphenicol sensitivity